MGRRSGPQNSCPGRCVLPPQRYYVELMKIIVGVPTHREPATIGEAVASLLHQRAADVRIVVSDRSPNQESLAALASLGPDYRLELRASQAPNALANFVETGRVMLARDGDFDGYALLAGDDHWSENLAAECVTELRANGVSIVTPVFTWFGKGELPSPLPLRFRQSQPWRREIAAVLRLGRLQPANLIYGVYGRAAFERLIALLAESDQESPYAFDVRVSFELIGEFAVAHSDSCSSYRRVDVETDLAVERLGMTPPPPRVSRLRKLIYGRLIVVQDAWLISAVLPRPWSAHPTRGLLTVIWTIEDSVELVRHLLRQSRTRQSPPTSETGRQTSKRPATRSLTASK